MLNWVLAVVIGVVIGGVGAAVFGRRYASARWMAPVLAIVGTLIAAGLGACGAGAARVSKAVRAASVCVELTSTAPR